MCEKNPLEKLEFTNQFDSSVDSSLPYKLVQGGHEEKNFSFYLDDTKHCSWILGKKRNCFDLKYHNILSTQMTSS